MSSKPRKVFIVPNRHSIYAVFHPTGLRRVTGEEAEKGHHSTHPAITSLGQHAQSTSWGRGENDQRCYPPRSFPPFMAKELVLPSGILIRDFLGVCSTCTLLSMHDCVDRYPPGLLHSRHLTYQYGVRRLSFCLTTSSPSVIGYRRDNTLSKW